MPEYNKKQPKQAIIALMLSEIASYYDLTKLEDACRAQYLSIKHTGSTDNRSLEGKKAAVNNNKVVEGIIKLIDRVI